MKDKPEKVSPAKSSLTVRSLLFLLKSALPVAVAVGTFVLYEILIATAPTAERKQQARQARLVDVYPAVTLLDPVHIEARGVVKAALEMTLSPQVSGEVIAVSENLIPGGRFEQGALIVELDSRDYEFAVRQRESELTRAKAALRLEEGNQEVAQREYEVLDQDLSDADKVLVFRQPQLETAQGDLLAAEAMLDDSKLDLERTTIRAPFDSLVTTKGVDLGTRLTPQSMIARLIGTDTFWVELSIPQAELQWIDLPMNDSPGSLVYLRHPKVWGANSMREGRVIRLLPELSEQGRMAKLLVAVDDPLGLAPENTDKPKLLIGQYLEADIVGKRVDGAIRVSRSHIRDGQNAWVMNEKDQLEVRPLDIVYSGREYVFVVDGLIAGERIVSTDLATIDEGMPLRVLERAPKTDDQDASAERDDS